MTNKNFRLVLPTINAASVAEDFIEALQSQTCQPQSILVLDSESTDVTKELFRDIGADVISIASGSFDHGTTRQFAVDRLLNSTDVLVFMTQDACLADDCSLENLIAAFRDDNVGASYGRQLPHKNAGPIETHARFFNYSNESQVKSLEDIGTLGIKTCFMSNSYAAYRTSALAQVGGFPCKNIVSEETYVAAKMLIAGWKIRYCADARVLHSHNYTYKQEFQRYFDLGVFHSREAWIRNFFGNAEGEGKRFVFSQLAYLKAGHAHLIPSALLRMVIKYMGYRLGFLEAYLPNTLKLCLSMQKHYWLN